MFTGEKKTPVRSGEVPAQDRIEPRIEIGIATSSPRVFLPRDHATVQQFGPGRSQPFKQAGESFDALLLYDFSGIFARLPSRHQSQNPDLASLLFIGIPHSPSRRITTISQRVTSFLPEAAIELQQTLRRSSIAQTGDRLRLFDG